MNNFAALLFFSKPNVSRVPVRKICRFQSKCSPLCKNYFKFIIDVHIDGQEYENDIMQNHFSSVTVLTLFLHTWLRESCFRCDGSSTIHTGFLFLCNILNRGIFRFFFLYVLYSTLLHLSPLRFHCVGGCWDRIQDCCDFGHWQSDALTTQQDLIHTQLDLIHAQLDLTHPF